MADLLAGIDIGNMLQSEGPIVKCVLLKADSVDNLPKSPSKPTDNKRTVLAHLVDEIDIDTTPKMNMVHQILGGKFTFLGQYEDEGIVLMIRSMGDVEECSLPVNPHVLQPPFDDADVRGDILVMKVTTKEEHFDDDENEEEETVGSPPKPDEFFLDYTKADYIAFAERTDVVAPDPQDNAGEEHEEGLDEDEDEEEEHPDEDSGSEESEDSGEEGDKEWDGGDEEEDEENRTAMMNLIMRQVLRRFHERQGRGPNTQELLDLRSAVAEKMGVQVPDIADADWNQKAIKTKREPIAESVDTPKSPYKSILTRKRTAINDDEDIDSIVTKKVKFGEEPLEEAKGDDKNDDQYTQESTGEDSKEDTKSIGKVDLEITDKDIQLS